MKLIDLISIFRRGEALKDFCKAQKLNEEAEVIEIYAQEPVGLGSELGFFPIEETEGRVEFQSEGVRYHNLFDFLYFWRRLKTSRRAKNQLMRSLPKSSSLLR
ncbi:MAG: hypothetical protein JWM59_4769 [Verrucomicrobiales bacterium]|nr:hypothetical protein [Verrucomicrobiales bacterium]